MYSTALSSAPPSTADKFLDELLGIVPDDAEYPQTGWWHGEAREKQLPPKGAWSIWLLLAGRGFGKTRSIVEWGIEQARTMPKSRGALVARIASDNRDVLVEGESGFLAKCSPDFMPKYEPSKRRLTFPNGSIITTYSADEPNTLRGPQHHWALCDELAAWQFVEAWDNLLMGLRLGVDPRVAIATTPRPVPLVKSLLADPTCIAVRGSTYDNAANLAPSFLTAIVKRYEGTRLGRQELNADILDDTPGALWNRAMLEQGRVTKAPELKRIVIAIDPSASSNEDSDETGIIAAGLGVDGHGYVLEDATLIGDPERRSKAAVALFHKYQADAIVAEANNGGDWIPFAIHTVDKTVQVKVVRASRGKYTRAEPVASLYEQVRVHHVGYLATLEDQQCSWTSASTDSPDRLDALVWALWALMLDGMGELEISAAPAGISDYFGA